MNDIIVISLSQIFLSLLLDIYMNFKRSNCTLNAQIKENTLQQP